MGQDGLTDLHARWLKEMPFDSFEGRVDMKLHFGVKTPENPKFCNPNAKISWQIETLEKLLNGKR